MDVPGIRVIIGAGTDECFQRIWIDGLVERVHLQRFTVGCGRNGGYDRFARSFGSVVRILDRGLAWTHLLMTEGRMQVRLSSRYLRV